MKTIHKLLNLFVVLLALVCIFPAQAYINYPAPVDNYINDFAKIIHPKDQQNITQLLTEIYEQTGIEIVVVTINSKHNYGYPGADIEGFTAELFDRWGVGNKETNNGVMILVAKDDRQVRIELGLGYAHRYDSQMQRIINNDMLPYLKTGDYSRAIYQGTFAVTQSVTKKISSFYYYRWEIGIAIAIVICIAAGISCMRSGKKGWGWIFFSVAIILIMLLLKLLQNSNRSNRGGGGSGGGGSFGGGKSGGGGASGSW